MAEAKYLRALEGILINGEHVAAGTVFPKSELKKEDWQNLVFGFNPPRLAEVDGADDEAVMPGVPKKATR